MPNQPGKTQEILADMKRIISEGKLWGERGRLPSREELKRMYTVSSTTINDVVMFLHAEGYIVTQGKSVIVNPHRLALPILVESFDGYLEANGIIPYMQNIGLPERAILTDHLAEMFELPSGTATIKRYRVQGEKNGKEIPYRLAETYYLEEIAGHHLETMLEAPRFNVTNALKRETGKAITTSEVKVIQRYPDTEEQQLLHIGMIVPVFEIFRKSLSDDGTLLMFSRLVGPCFRFMLTFEAKTPI